jgi:hypothetical protein
VNSRDPARPWTGIDERVSVLAPAGAGTLGQFLDSTARGAIPGVPFADERLAAIAALSVAFLAHPVLRQDPASTAAAFWMRRAQLVRLRDQFGRRAAAEPGVTRVPAGRVLHLAPSNVDTLFVYSWALAFLCGNSSVVRLSRQRGAVVEAMLEAITAIAREHELIRRADRFVSYEHDEDVTTALSAWCAQRVLWGGDEVVAALRPLPLPAHASERVFGSKFSYAVLSADAWRSADATERGRVAAACFNDLFWFDQMACSSPHLLFWLGSAAAVPEAVAAFDDALQAEATRRGFAASPSSASQRRTFAFELAAASDVRVRLDHPAFVSVRVADGVAPTRATCGGGLLRHHRLDTLDALEVFASERDQTVTHWGFPAAEIEMLAAKLGARGVDRVVPVGEALAFEPVWDGFDLLDDFTRRVRVRTA